MEETHISSLKTAIEEKKAEIEGKLKHISLLKDGVDIDKQLLKVMERGLIKLTTK